jgi:hypothetical protein
MPRKVDVIIESGDHIFDNSENQFLRSVKGAEVLIYDELIKILDNLDISAGRLRTNEKAEAFLMTMDQKIYAALKKADYNNSVLKYTSNFNEIADNTKELQSTLNGINITDAQINPFLKIEVNNTIDKLTGAGMAKDFINPIRQSLYRNIMLGAEVTSVEKTLKDYLISSGQGDSKLLKYVKQTSRDAMQQFDGTLQANIGTELGLNAIRYVGSLIADSRKQCVRWIENDNGILMVADLQEEINWAFNNGSGMNPDTTPLTFAVYRGGFNCRHRAIYTKVLEE